MPADLGKVEREDKEILKDLSQGSKYQIHAALIRRSKQGDERAKERAMELLDHSSEWVRSGAFHGLGHFPVEASLFQSGLKDPSEKVQKHTLRGLGEVRSEDRVKVLSEFLGDANDSILRAEALRALIKQTQEPATKTRYILDLTELFEEEQEDERFNSMLRILLNLGPRNDWVLASLESQIVQNQKHSSWPVMITHFAAVKPEVVTGYFGILQNQSREIDSSLLQAAARNCFDVDPKWGLEVLHSLEDDHLWRQAFLNLYHLFGQNFVAKVVEDLSDRKQQLVIQDVASMQNQSLKSRCLSD